MRLYALTVLMLLLISMSILSLTNIWGYGIKHGGVNNILSIKTYLVTYYFDQEHGGILKQYTSNLFKRNITVSRYGLFTNKSINALLYEIIPPPTTTGVLPKNWWPGIILRRNITYSIINETVYKIVIGYKVFFPRYNLGFYKTMIFYYGKPYYIVEYKFINRGGKTLYFDLTSN